MYDGNQNGTGKPKKNKVSMEIKMTSNVESVIRIESRHEALW